MTVISDGNYNVWGSRNFLASTQQLYGDMATLTRNAHWYLVCTKITWNINDFVLPLI